MQMISKYNKGIPYLWCIIDIYNKYAWVVPLEDMIGITNIKAFQKLLDECKFKGQNSSKIWVNKDSELLNKSMKTWLQDINIEMYST